MTPLAPSAAKDEPSHHGSYNSEHDVEEQAGARVVDDLGGDESGDQSKYNSTDNRHARPPLLVVGT